MCRTVVCSDHITPVCKLLTLRVHCIVKHLTTSRHNGKGKNNTASIYAKVDVLLDADHIHRFLISGNFDSCSLANVCMFQVVPYLDVRLCIT